MDQAKLFSFSSTYQFGRRSITFNVDAFDDFLFFSQSFSILPLGKSKIPYGSIKDIIWDSGIKITLNWDEGGMFRQSIIMSEEENLSKVVSQAVSANQQISVNTANKDKPLSMDTDTNSALLIIFGMFLFVGVVIWGARYLGLIPYP